MKLLACMAVASALLRPAPVVSRRGPSLCAKKGKKGKKKGGGQQKTSGMAWAKDFEVKPYDSTALRALAADACGAYEARTGTPLDASLAGAADLPKALFAAPVALLVAAPAPEGAGGARVAYANAAACEMFGAPHGAVIGTETPLAAALPAGFESKYAKKVGAATLRDAARFAIERVAVVDGALATEAVGVGYRFEAWTRADGRVCRPGGVVEDAPPDPAEAAALIAAQADAVRALKDSGKGNKDPDVTAAVAELLRLKALLPDDAA